MSRRAIAAVITSVNIQQRHRTCTMHPKLVDLGPTLKALGKNPKGDVVKVPLPNHSHIIEGANFKPVWWQIKVVLVTDPSVWPDVNGTTGINSVESLRAAQAAGF